MLFVLRAEYYQSFMRNQEGIKIDLQKKVHRRICVTDITILTVLPPFQAIFYCFLRLLPPSFEVKNLLHDP